MTNQPATADPRRQPWRVSMRHVGCRVGPWHDMEGKTIGEVHVPVLYFRDRLVVVFPMSVLIGFN